MKSPHSIRYLTRLYVVLVCAGMVAWASDAIAKPRRTESVKKATVPFAYNPPKAPRGQGSPIGRREGGASRGSCNNYVGLTALVPEQAGRVEGATVADNPTFYFYIPAALSPNVKVEFVLQDQDDACENPHPPIRSRRGAGRR